VAYSRGLKQARCRGESRLTIRHTADAPFVDAWLRSTDPNTSNAGGIFARGLKNPNQLGPIDIEAGSYAATLFVQGTERVDLGVFDLEAATSYILYAVGSYPDSFDLLIQTKEITSAGPAGTTLTTIR